MSAKPIEAKVRSADYPPALLEQFKALFDRKILRKKSQMIFPEIVSDPLNATAAAELNFVSHSYSFRGYFAFTTIAEAGGVTSLSGRSALLPDATV